MKFVLSADVRMGLADMLARLRRLERERLRRPSSATTHVLERARATHRSVHAPVRRSPECAEVPGERERT